MKKYKTVKVGQEDWDVLISGKHITFKRSKGLSVGSYYSVRNPENPDDGIIAICTQDCPHTLLKIDQ